MLETECCLKAFKNLLTQHQKRVIDCLHHMTLPTPCSHQDTCISKLFGMTWIEPEKKNSRAIGRVYPQGTRLHGKHSLRKCGGCYKFRSIVLYIAACARTGIKIVIDSVDLAFSSTSLSSPGVYCTGISLWMFKNSNAAYLGREIGVLVARFWRPLKGPGVHSTRQERRDFIWYRSKGIGKNPIPLRLQF